MNFWAECDRCHDMETGALLEISDFVQQHLDLFPNHRIIITSALGGTGFVAS